MHIYIYIYIYLYIYIYIYALCMYTYLMYDNEMYYEIQYNIILLKHNYIM